MTLLLHFSDALDQDACPQAPAAAHGDQPIAALRPPQLVSGFGDEKTPGLTLDEVMAADFRARVFHPDDVESLHDERQEALAS